MSTHTDVSTLILEHVWGDAVNPSANSLLCLFVCNNITVKVVSDFKIKMAAVPNVGKTEDLSFIFFENSHLL